MRYLLTCIALALSLCSFETFAAKVKRQENPESPMRTRAHTIKEVVPPAPKKARSDSDLGRVSADSPTFVKKITFKK